MIGVTNAINMRTKWNVDEYTSLLITDSIEDKSHYQSTIVNNNVIVATDLQRDGRNTLLFTVNQSPYLEITDKFDFITGDKDYTIEWWGYHLNSNNNNGSGCIFHGPGGGSNCHYGLLLGHNQSFPERTWASDNGTSWNVFSDKYNNTGLFNHGVNTWYHYAFVRKNIRTYSVYINGNLRWTETKADSFSCIITSTNSTALIGAYWNGTTKYYINRHTFYLQDFRISSCARYIEPFTPPQRFL